MKWIERRSIRLSEADGQTLALKTYKGKRNTILAGACLTVAFELLALIYVILRRDAAGPSGAWQTYTSLYIILLSVTVACLIIMRAGRRYFESRPTVFLNACVIYSFFICLWAGYLSAYSHRSAADISVYLYVCLCISVLIPMKPWQAALLYAASWTFFAVMLTVFINPALSPFSSLLNSGFTSVLAIVIASVFHRSRVGDYLNERTILDQNAKIQQMNEQLKMMVTVDDLTQIHNRRFMEREFPAILADARRRGVPAAMIMMDIDLFKQYNDRYGHQAGDNCLRDVADIVMSSLPGRDAYFIRYGGEEFLLMLVGIEPEDVRRLAERIRRDVERAALPHEDNESGCVTLSIGVCCSRGDGKASVSQLIRYADTAMYDAKAAGRNVVSVYLFTEVLETGEGTE